MRKFVAILCLTLVGGAALWLPGTLSAAESNEMMRIDEVSCKDIMRTSGENRVTALAILHGYMLGKRGVTTIDAQAMGQTSDQFIEHCLDHPDDAALSSFETISK